MYAIIKEKQKSYEEPIFETKMRNTIEEANSCLEEWWEDEMNTAFADVETDVDEDESWHEDDKAVVYTDEYVIHFNVIKVTE